MTFTLEALAVPEDQRERVVKVVRNARDHRAEGTEALPLHELLFSGTKVLERRLERRGALENALFQDGVLARELQVKLACPQEIANPQQTLGRIERLDQEVGRPGTQRAL